MFENVTIKDIAKALGLSTSTVSRALRGSSEINFETKKAVLEYAEKYNYRPNPIALSLKENRSKAIGVIVPEIDNPFFSQAINGIEEIADKRGYHVVISQSHESLEKEKINIEHLASRRVDGLLISLSGETQNVLHLLDLHQKGMPMVLFDRISDEIDTHKVTSENFEGAFRATEHLIKNGKKKIAHLGASPYLSITKERLEGYLAAHQKNEISIDQNLIKYCNYGYEEMEKVMEDLFKNTKPDAIFTSSDRLVLDCLTALKNRNIAIPQDISIIGFTNLTVAPLLSPSLSTVVQPALEMGKFSAELLLDLIEKKGNLPTIFQKLVLKTELVLRDSSKL